VRRDNPIGRSDRHRLQRLGAVMSLRSRSTHPRCHHTPSSSRAMRSETAPMAQRQGRSMKHRFQPTDTVSRPILAVAISLSLALLAAGTLALAPLRSSTKRIRVYNDSGVPQERVERTRSTLIDREGRQVLYILVAPAAVAAAALALSWTRYRRNVWIAASVALVAFVALSILSIGIFYVPSAIAMVIATALGTETA
jgi:hypothetical protein